MDRNECKCLKGYVTFRKLVNPLFSESKEVRANLY